jgi:hypothetical protein
VVTMKNAVFWNVTPCGSCASAFLQGVLQLLVTANIVPNSLILFTPKCLSSQGPHGLTSQTTALFVYLLYSKSLKHKIWTESLGFKTYAIIWHSK